MRTTPLLAALLMLGGVSSAYAQEGPSEEPRARQNADRRPRKSEARTATPE
jgi:hypothetical protein